MDERWVPVTDCLPDPGWVLVAVDLPGLRPPVVAIATWSDHHQHWRSVLMRQVEGRVTHWMPLPEPPQEVRDV